MYVCTDCGRKFEKPLKIKESETEALTVARSYFVCPECKSENIKEKPIRYCKCCGRRMGDTNENYCSLTCKKQGEILFERQRQRGIHIKNSPIYKTVRMLEAYNKEHKTFLTYGQFTANVLPKLLKVK